MDGGGTERGGLEGGGAPVVVVAPGLGIGVGFVGPVFAACETFN